MKGSENPYGKTIEELIEEIEQKERVLEQEERELERIAQEERELKRREEEMREARQKPYYEEPLQREREKEDLDRAVEDYVLMLRAEYEKHNKKMPDYIRESSLLVVKKRTNEQQIDELIGQIQQLEEQKQKLEAEAKKYCEAPEYVSYLSIQKEARKKYEDWREKSNSYRESEEGKKEGEKLHNDWDSKLTIFLDISRPYDEKRKEIEKLEEQIENIKKRILHCRIGPLEKIKEEYFENYYDKCRKLYEETLENNGFNNEEAEIPLVVFLRTMIKGLRRENVDICCIKNAGIAQYSIETKWKYQRSEFKQIIAGALCVKKSQLDECVQPFSFDTAVELALKMSSDPIIGFLKHFVKDLSIQDLDFEFIQQNGITDQQQLFSTILYNREKFEEFFARSIRAETKQIHEYLIRIDPTNTLSKIAELENELIDLDKEYNRYDDDEGHNTDRLGSIRDIISSKSKTSLNLENEMAQKAYTVDKIRSISAEYGFGLEFETKNGDTATFFV